MERSCLHSTENPAVFTLESIPGMGYPEFVNAVDALMSLGTVHCLSYFAVPESRGYRFFCLLADDSNGRIIPLSHVQPSDPGLVLPSVTAKHYPFHIFEREIQETTGIAFANHPWLKPVRFPGTSTGKGPSMDTYPFYSISGEELHEVGVGPIHAGVIEPGYFRFLCNGEKVLHLEIQLGYQHRGVETLMAGNATGLGRMLLAESIAGDTAVGHALCHAQLIEALSGISVSEPLRRERIVALELERIAVHIGDTAALCADVAYQFGQAVNEALRTIVINTTQSWCGNRFGKGLVRTGGSHYPATPKVSARILENLQEAGDRYAQMANQLFTMSSVLNRFETTGKVTRQQVELIGAVGMAARSSGLKRDIRWSHPFQAYRDMGYNPVVIEEGDVYARALLRRMEVDRSIGIIRDILTDAGTAAQSCKLVFDLPLHPSALAVSMTEGWRGEIVHAAVTGPDGTLVHYKVTDPSLHNWMALALAVRNQEISDFPLCNKSFNLSYCGHDL